MPRNAPQVKLDATRALGADIVLYERPGEDRDEVAAGIVAETGATLVHAFADAWVIEGQGSAGVEIAAQLDRAPSRLVACCGGGGLSAGLALACPDSAVHVVEPHGWDMVGQALEAGKVRDNVRHVLLEEQHPKHQGANPDHVERHSPAGEKVAPLLQRDLNPRDWV